MADNEDVVEASFISALDDVAIRKDCFEMAMSGYGTDFDKTLENAMVLYDWVMGNDDQTIEEAADPASLTPEESCEPQRH